MEAIGKIAIVVAAAFGATSGPVSAAGQQQTVTEFFSDESETTTVGWTIIYCDGSHIHTGSYSFYSEEFDYTCS